MKYNQILVSAIIAAIFLFGSGYSLDPYTISILSDKDAVFAGQKITYIATVTSNLNRSGIVDFFITGGAETSWVTLNTYSLELEPGETKSFTYYISPPFNTPVNKYFFRLKAVSGNDTQNRQSIDINLYVIEVSKIDITAFSADKSDYLMGENVRLTFGVKNLGTGRSKNSTMTITLSGESSDEKTLNIPPLEVEEEYMQQIEYSFDKHRDKDSYFISGNLSDDKGKEIMTKKASFVIESRSIIDKTRSESSTIFEKTITIQVVNNGNDFGVAEILEDKSDIPQVVTFSRPPEEVTIGGKAKYRWICNIGPLEKCSVSYTIKYWIYFVIVLISVAVIFIIVNILEQPTIIKRWKGGKTHSVSIEVMNNGMRSMNDVQVQDFVPSVFNVVESGATIVPAVVKKRKDGTLLVWKLGKMRSKDERIISYRIEPILQVTGKIALPPAKIIGRTKFGGTKRAVSRIINVQ